MFCKNSTVLTTLRAILVDNTASNIDWKGGLVVKVEKALKKNLHTIGCMLHFNELPFRKFFRGLMAPQLDLVVLKEILVRKQHNSLLHAQ